MEDYITGTNGKQPDEVIENTGRMEFWRGTGGAVMRLKRPARISYGVEINPRIVEEWKRVEFPSLRLICGDAVRFLSRFQWSGSEVVYLDPPYLVETRSYKRKVYRYEMMTEEEHAELLKAIKRIPARVIISGYWSPLYAEMLKDWRAVSFTTVKRNGEKATEWLWMNYAPTMELHDYRYLGANYRERDRIKRKRQRWEKKLREMPVLEAHAMMSALETVRAERSGFVTPGDTASSIAAGVDGSGAIGIPGDDGSHHHS